jgi:hypothetical protein
MLAFYILYINKIGKKAKKINKHVEKRFEKRVELEKH